MRPGVLLIYTIVYYNMERKLRTLLEAVEKEVLRKPSRKTLDRLSLLAGFQDWNAFLKSFNGDVRQEEDTAAPNDSDTTPSATADADAIDGKGSSK